ncbi:MAG: hypothetical protein PUP93_16740 [Rhizonema sp. NSF051]|nr:hypothetical protein [Rhizonema sp. NSF051]
MHLAKYSLVRDKESAARSNIEHLAPTLNLYKAETMREKQVLILQVLVHIVLDVLRLNINWCSKTEAAITPWISLWA